MLLLLLYRSAAAAILLLLGVFKDTKQEGRKRETSLNLFLILPPILTNDYQSFAPTNQ
jgi:hypothetical protein